MNTYRTTEQIVSEMKVANVKMFEYKGIGSTYYILTKDGVAVHQWVNSKLGWFGFEEDPALIGETEKELRKNGFKTVTNANTKKYYSGRIVPIILGEQNE